MEPGKTRAMTQPSISQQLTPVGGWQSPGRNRLSPLKADECSIFTRILIGLINRIGRLEASNLFMMLIRNLRLFFCWLTFSSRLMPYGELNRRETELVILRVAWNCRSRYEWGQHVDISMRAGVSADDIARIPQGADALTWEPKLATLMRACDEFHRDRMIAEVTWLQLAEYYKPRHLLEVLMLIGHYEMLAGVLNSTGLPLDTRLESVLASAAIHGK